MICVVSTDIGTYHRFILRCISEYKVGKFYKQKKTAGRTRLSLFELLIDYSIFVPHSGQNLGILPSAGA